MLGLDEMSIGRSRTYHTGFTLVELLVVIAIISILAGMLLPSLSKARESVMAIDCANNMKNFNLYFSLYADQNRSSLPYTRNSDSSIKWFHLMMIQMNLEEANLTPGSLGIWNCPENAEQTHPYGSGNGEAFNSYMPNGYNGLVSEELQRQALGNKLTRFKDPSSCSLLLEGTYYRVNPSGDSGDGSVPAVTLGPSYVRYPHFDGLNVLYSDGHTGSWAGPLKPRGTFSGGSYPDCFENGRFWFSGAR